MVDRPGIAEQESERASAFDGKAEIVPSIPKLDIVRAAVRRVGGQSVSPVSWQTFALVPTSDNVPASAPAATARERDGNDTANLRSARDMLSPRCLRP